MADGGFLFLGIGLARKLVDFEPLENRGVFTVELPCMQCKQSLPYDQTSELLYCDEGIYFFCSKTCWDRWMSVNTSQIDPENKQQAAS